MINVVYRYHFTMEGFKGETNATSEVMSHIIRQLFKFQYRQQDSLSFKELFILQLNNDKGKAELEEVSRLLCTCLSLSV